MRGSFLRRKLVRNHTTLWRLSKLNQESCSGNSSPNVTYVYWWVPRPFTQLYRRRHRTFWINFISIERSQLTDLIFFISLFVFEISRFNWWTVFMARLCRSLVYLSILSSYICNNQVQEKIVFRSTTYALQWIVFCNKSIFLKFSIIVSQLPCSLKPRKN